MSCAPLKWPHLAGEEEPTKFLLEGSGEPAVPIKREPQLHKFKPRPGDGSLECHGRDSCMAGAATLLTSTVTSNSGILDPSPPEGLE